ncbi:hypothetical protein [Aquifex aeolicus]|uniref:hypothetical protein n=1 Tax=Aquifex aeolicus TaxID=63363 RepID=UPI000318228A|nr:hypothetical protein [Aquifex aeolicus]
MSDQFKYARFKRWVRIATLIFFFIVMAYAYYHFKQKQKSERKTGYRISTSFLPARISPK